MTESVPIQLHPAPDHRPAPGGQRGGGAFSSRAVPEAACAPLLAAPDAPYLADAAPAIYAAAERLLDAGQWHDDGTFVYLPPRDAAGAQDPDACALVALGRGLRHARLGPTRPYCPPPAGPGRLDAAAAGAWRAVHFVASMLVVGGAVVAALALVRLARAGGWL